MNSEQTVRGIIIKAAPYGEYGRRLVMLTDRLGKITVFATGAARAGSHVIGSVRPLTCAEFTLAKGRSAWNLRSVKLIDSFEELSLDPERYMYAAYILETAEFYSAEGMDETDSKQLLNLIYVSFDALRKKELTQGDIKAAYELRLLRQQGEYAGYADITGDDEGKGAAGELWEYCLEAGLSKLYEASFWNGFDERDRKKMAEAAAYLMKRQSQHGFRSEKLLTAF